MNSNKIFISIACFMDPDIINTIEDCLDKAMYPKNITFGICLQYDPKDDFLKNYNNNPQFRIHRMHWNEAKGPTYARYFCSKLIKDEKYFMQIDCHSRFFNNWDETAINCLNECNDSYAILTAFPISISNMYNKNAPLNISTKKFQSLSYDSIKLGSVCCSNNLFVKTYYLSAAFLFGPTNFLRDVPYDPYLTYSYQTIEQQFYAIRLFTHGWNLYKPSKHILATKYNKTIHKDATGSIINAPSNHKRGKLSWKRVCYYYSLTNLNDVELKKDINMYGLGNKRSLDDFFAIHNESGCIEKIKKGLTYQNGKWSRFNFYCRNNIFAQVLNKSELFKPSKTNIDFEWNIHTKVYDKILQNYNMSDVSFIDNKYTFFKLLTENNIKNIPKTYFNVNDIKQTNCRNFFLKYAGNNGGKNVFLYNKITELANHINYDTRPYIIQEEVPNMLLINDKKFILRNWIVLVDNKFYISLNGCCIIHEHKYDKNSKDRKIHIDHDIRKITYSNYNKEPFYKDTIKKVCILNTNICNVIKEKLKFKNNCYQVIGLDIIFDNKLDPYIIEFNSWPNMSVPYESYKSILKEFFINFLDDIVIKKLNNQPITDTDYFIELKIIKNCNYK
tara:strand:- start:3316 stop:5160 length:1845 start_codon:yes stop_codon:yes gene_type:complete